MSKYIIFILEALLLLVTPIILLTISSQFLAIRHVFFLVGGLYCSWRLYHKGATLGSLGFHRIHFRRSLRELALPSFLIVLSIYLLFILLPTSILSRFVGYDSLNVVAFAPRLIAYVFLSSPIQELIFRGYLTWRLKEVFTDNRIIQAISIGLFTFAHIPFYSPILLVITFFMGLFYIRNYQKYQNIYAVIISHSFVGACLILIRNAWFPF